MKDKRKKEGKNKKVYEGVRRRGKNVFDPKRSNISQRERTMERNGRESRNEP